MRPRPLPRLVGILLPVLGALSILALWQVAVPALGVPAYVAPTPISVFRKLVDEWPFLLANTVPTLIEAVLGFLFGTLAAVGLAVVFVHSRIARAAYFPVVLFFNTIPVLALAPIIILIFGLGMLPKVIIAAVICFFPTLVNMVRGFNLATLNELELMHVLSASKLEIFWRLRAPRSVPLLFASMKIASTTCVIGAVVGEWIGSNQGLGAVIIQATFNYQSERLFAAVIIASTMALLLFSAVVLAERFFVRARLG